MDLEEEFIYANVESIRIEFSLNKPQIKYSTESFIHSLFKDLEVNQELDIHSLNYVPENNTDNFVQKVLVHFKCFDVGEKFYKKICDDYKEHCYDVIMDVVDKSDTVNPNISLCRSPRLSLSSTDDSIYVINENCSCINDDFDEVEPIINEKSYSNNNAMLLFENNQLEIISHNQFKEDTQDTIISSETLALLPDKAEFNSTDNFAVQTNESGVSIDDLPKIKNSQEETLSVGMESFTNEIRYEKCDVTKEENDENNVYLDFITNKKINPRDLNSIIIFFENEKMSGGGEIVDFKLHELKKPWENNQRLSIKFKSAAGSRKVLDTKLFLFDTYLFEAHESLDNTAAMIDPRRIILTGCNERYSPYVIRMLAENLIRHQEFNSVLSVFKSKIFTNTFIVEFESDLHDISAIQANLKHHCLLLKDNCMQLIQAECTRSLVVKPVSQPIQEVESVFNGLKATKYAYENLHVIGFGTNECLVHCVSELEKSGHSNDYLFEEIYSYEMLKIPLMVTNEIVQPPKKVNHQKRLTLGLVFIASLILHNIFIDDYSRLNHVNESLDDPTVQLKDSFPQPSITISPETYPKLSVLSYFYETHFEKLADDLFEFDTIAFMQENGNLKLFLNKEISTEITADEYQKMKNDWLLSLNAFIADYFNLFETKTVFIRNSVINRLTYNRLRVNLKMLERSNKIFQYEVCGYKDSVEDLIKKINHENNLEYMRINLNL